MEFSRTQHRDDVTGVQWDSGMQLTRGRFGMGMGTGMGMDGYTGMTGSDHFNAWSCLLMKSNDYQYIVVH